ncbi:MAG: biotin--[acetyl-CoA-carboxylase] ligase [Oscillospiraceae bacterium]
MSSKSEILKVLEAQKGKSVSGEELATHVGVSRTAIWKAINSLKADGYDIKAVTNKGYMLEDLNDILSVEGILPFVEDAKFIEKLQIFDVLESTNITAKKLGIDGAPSGTIIIANEQTSGRGRMGRKFYSPPNTGLYMSCMLRPSVSADDCVLITTATSVAVCRAIEGLTKRKPKIKWVNDIFLDGKKVCGILTEAVTDFESGSIECVVVGIGINVDTVDFPTEIQNIAGGIYAERTGKISRNQLAARVICELSNIENMIKSHDYIEEYKKRSMVLGKEVRIISGKEEIVDVVDIDQNGGLVIKHKDGEVTVLRTGEVSVRLTNT